MAWYFSGTVAISAGGTVVTGTGTGWAGVVQAGWGLVGPDGRTYEIVSVNGIDSLTIAPAYLGPPVTGGAYRAFPTQSLAADLTAQINTLIDAHDPAAVAITGGTIDATAIGSTTRAQGLFSGVGVGTSAPAAPLHVIGEVRAVSDASTWNYRMVSSSGVSSGLWDAAGNVEIYLYSAAGVLGARFGSSAASFITSGNFGLGLETPQAQLHVLGSARIEAQGGGVLDLRDSGASGAAAMAYMRMQDSLGATLGYIGVGSTGTADIQYHNAIDGARHVFSVGTSSLMEVGPARFAVTVAGYSAIVIDQGGRAIFNHGGAYVGGTDNTLTGVSLGSDWSWFTGNSGGSYVQYIQSVAAGPSYQFQLFVAGSSAVGAVTSDGASTNYGTTSDYRMKENVSTPNGADARAVIEAMGVRRFNFIGQTRQVFGFLAHELQQVVPEAVTGQKDAIDTDGAPVLQAVDQSKLVPYLAGALQHAFGLIDDLGARVAQLEAA